MNQVIKIKDIVQRIFVVRGIKVMLDRDLAELYQVETRVLNQAVRRNLKRFPKDFMFQLDRDEFDSLKSQFVTSSWGGVRKMPLAFTEQGVAMLSGILNSDRAIEVNIRIMRAFVRLRHVAVEHSELKRAVAELRKQTEERFEIVFAVLDRLISDEETEKKKIGFIDSK